VGVEGGGGAEHRVCVDQCLVKGTPWYVYICRGGVVGRTKLQASMRMRFGEGLS
jgi:hypothetical protein